LEPLAVICSFAIDFVSSRCFWFCFKIMFCYCVLPWLNCVIMSKTLIGRVLACARVCVWNSCGYCTSAG
jgi:hypothetical protein